MKKPKHPAAQRKLYELYLLQYKLSRKPQYSLKYLETQSAAMKRLRRDLEGYGVSEYDYHEWAMELYKEWDKEFGHER